VTTAPEITLTAVGADGRSLPVGSVVQADASGTVQLHRDRRAAPWVDVTARAAVSCPGRRAASAAIAAAEMALPWSRRAPRCRRVDAVVRVAVPRAARFLESRRRSRAIRSLWPVVIPYEIPTLLLTDAVRTLGAALGLPDELGALKPRQQTQTRPYALSNPILVDGDGDGRFGLAPVRHAAARADGSGDSARLVDSQISGAGGWAASSGRRGGGCARLDSAAGARDVCDADAAAAGSRRPESTWLLVYRVPAKQARVLAGAGAGAAAGPEAVALRLAPEALPRAVGLARRSAEMLGGHFAAFCGEAPARDRRGQRTRGVGRRARGGAASPPARPRARAGQRLRVAGRSRRAAARGAHRRHRLRLELVDGPGAPVAGGLSLHPRAGMPCVVRIAR